MLRSHDMCKLTIFALNKQRAALLSKIHEIGLIQPKDLKSEEIAKELSKPGVIDDLRDISESLLRISRLVSILKLAPQKLSFAQSMFGLDILHKEKVKRRDAKEIIKDIKTFLDKNEKRLLSLEDVYNKTTEKLGEIKEFKRIADIFEKLDMPLNLLKDTKRISVTSGSISKVNVEKLKKELEDELEGFVHIDIKENKKECVFTIITLKENSSNVNFLTKKYNSDIFTIPDWDITDAPSKWIEVKTKEFEKEISEITSRIEKERKNLFNKSVVLREEIEILKQRYETIHSMLESENFFVMQGWALKNKVQNLEKELISTTNGKIVIEVNEPTQEEQEEVPIELANNKFLKPFEMLTELYALPKYKDLDPTFIVGPIFIIFAAFMLTDAIYGIFLVILGVILLKKFAPYSKGLKDICISILGIGILTIIFGVLTGSYFGNLPEHLWGIHPEKLAIWREPLTDPLYFLIIAIGTAVVYLNIGFILGSIDDIKKKDYKTMFKERVVWFLIQIGVALLALRINPNLFSIFGKNIGLATLILILSVVAIIATHGPLGLLSITGLMGDMISFSRLFALSLSTAGIALAVNLLASLVIKAPYVGIILAVIVFIIGHMFGFVMNSIGSFVHSLRLQFVEFFGRFYEGGGDRFMPLKEERSYTEVKEK